jgi:regulator of cell morphogenesis and NO signaling
MATENTLVEETGLLYQMTLSEIVNKDFRTAQIFEKYNLDFCCRGNKSLSEACNEKGLKSENVFSELQNISVNNAANSIRYDEWELDFLIDYIINNHHNYIRSITPLISSLAGKVVSAHGKNHPEVIKIAEIFSTLGKELSQHLMKEEQILFPYIKNLVNIKNNNSKYEPPYFSSVENPIRMMEAEHTAAADEMYEIRNLSKNYLIPSDACNTFKVFYKELKEFEEDLHKHVYLENNILFPKSIELEKELLNK